MQMSCNFQEILRDSSANSPVISRCPDSGKRQHPTRPINYAERKRVTGDGYFRFPAYSIIPASSQLFRHNTEASMATTNLSYNQMNILRIKGGRGGGWIDMWHHSKSTVADYPQFIRCSDSCSFIFTAIIFRLLRCCSALLSFIHLPTPPFLSVICFSDFCFMNFLWS